MSEGGTAANVRVHFLPGGRVVHAVSGRRGGDLGEAGSLLDIALSQGVAIEHSCGGVAGCATCHCIIRSGGEALSPPAPEELRQLPNAVGREAGSRLACQVVPPPGADLVVEIPPLE